MVSGILDPRIQTLRNSEIYLLLHQLNNFILILKGNFNILYL